MTAEFGVYFILAVAAITFAMNIVSDVRMTRRDERWNYMFKQLMDNYKGTVEHALTMAKAQNVAQAVEAQALKDARDIQVEALRDEMAGAEEETKPQEPIKVMTSDGREIDLRDWEVVA